MTPRFSFIVPFHRDLASLARCLEGLKPLPADNELIVVADGALEDCRPLALRHRARIVSVPGPSGPALARNAPAAVAAAQGLVLIDPASSAAARCGVRVAVHEPLALPLAPHAGGRAPALVAWIRRRSPRCVLAAGRLRRAVRAAIGRGPRSRVSAAGSGVRGSPRAGAGGDP